MFAEKTALRIPGPTPVPPQVTRAMTQAMIGHRSSAFSTLLADVEARLRPLFGTSGDVAVLAGTGTAALEAAVCNMVTATDTVLAISTGNFGDRFADIARRTGASLHVARYAWGEAADPQDIERLLTEHPATKVVLLTHCETSTGVLNDVQSIARVVRAHGGYLIVDAVSSFLGAPLPMDDWDVDVVATGSQKVLALPPGIGLVGYGARALARMRDVARPSLYFDLVQYHDDLLQDTTPFTPPVSLVYGLQATLQLIEQEGIGEGYARHLRLRDMVRAGCRAMGLPLLVADDRYASPTVTTVCTPGFDADVFRQQLRLSMHVEVAGGQEQFAGSLLRIGHMGYVDAADVLQCIAAMEVVLYQSGHSKTLGAGITAAQEVFVHE